MARARNIKPAFFTNELLGVLDPIIGLTFIGLWCLADKDGRLEDRPLRIKAELFPYRDGTDVNRYLTVLEREGFIDRYVVDGKIYIQVVNFHKHQSPHHTERAKGYPSKPLPSKEKQELTVNKQLRNGECQVSTRSDSLIPDSLIPDSKTIRAPRFDARAHLSSLGVPDQIAIDWIAHRRAKRATPTRTAIDGIARQAEAAGLYLGDALGMCCERGWTGFKADWLTTQHQPGRRQTVTETRTETVATLTGRIRHANQLEERDITPGLLRIAK